MKKNYRMKSLAVLLTAALALGGCQGSTDEAETETADTRRQAARQTDTRARRSEFRPRRGPRRPG